MKGIILAGDKHPLPVGRELMIYNHMRNMKACGIEGILIVTSSSSMGDMVNLLGSGKEFDVSFAYGVEEEALGIAKPVLYFTTNCLREQNGVGVRVLAAEVARPRDFGIAAADETRIPEIREEPEGPRSNYSVVGAYLYDSRVLGIMGGVKASERGEFEIRSVDNEHTRVNEQQYDFVEREWMDTGTSESCNLENLPVFPGSPSESPS
jgi:glucose-1-phosphate thymidylyltransferase